MFISFRRNKLLVGIDHRASGYKSLQLARRGSRYCVQSISHTIVQQPAAIAVSGEGIINKIVSIDAQLTALQIESAVWDAAKKYFPELLGQIYLDYHVFGKNDLDPNLNDLLLVACRQEKIRQLLSDIEHSDCQIRVVDVDYYALSRAVRILNRDTQNNTIAYVDINHQASIWLVQQGDKILFARSQSINAANVEQHMQQFLKFYSACDNYQQLDQIVLSGECALSTAEISSAIKIPTKIANPFDHLDFKNPVDFDEFYAFGPAFMLCVGLALRSEKNNV